LIGSLDAEFLIADKGYDSPEILELAREKGMVVVIPPRRNRKEPWDYNCRLYKMRRLV
jgi:hypothetical protein